MRMRRTHCMQSEHSLKQHLWVHSVLQKRLLLQADCNVSNVLQILNARRLNRLGGILRLNLLRKSERSAFRFFFSLFFSLNLSSVSRFRMRTRTCQIHSLIKLHHFLQLAWMYLFVLKLVEASKVRLIRLVSAFTACTCSLLH
jgi:hypothetical protein